MSWSLVLLFFSLPMAAMAKNKTLFEAYYKIASQGKHVGYYIQRYELDPKKKEFISTYFLRTNKFGGNISESLKARATEKLTPINYQFTSLQGKQAKTIDANVRKNKRGEDVLQVKYNENGKLRVSEKKLKSGTFFSTFLIYLLLQGEKGITTGVKYSFDAIAEEDGKAYRGEVYIDSEEQKMNMNTYKVLNTFKRSQFVNFINGQGESLVTVYPSQSLTATIVTNSNEATQNIPYNTKSLSMIFNDVPKGNVHSLANKTKAPKLDNTIKAKKVLEKKKPGTQTKEEN